MSETGCVFCAVVAALRGADTCPHPESGAPVHKIRGLPASIAILGHDQYYRGYTLVVAKTHATELFELADAERRQHLDDMVGVARALAAAFSPRKLNYELLGNTVPHLHWHLFPRYANDPNPLRPVWERDHGPVSLSPEACTEMIGAIRRHLD